MTHSPLVRPLTLASLTALLACGGSSPTGEDSQPSVSQALGADADHREEMMERVNSMRMFFPLRWDFGIQAAILRAHLVPNSDELNVDGSPGQLAENINVSPIQKYLFTTLEGGVVAIPFNVDEMGVAWFSSSAPPYAEPFRNLAQTVQNNLKSAFVPHGALQVTSLNAGFTPNSTEMYTGDSQFVFQRAEKRERPFPYEDSLVRVYYAHVGDWANVQCIEWVEIKEDPGSVASEATRYDTVMHSYYSAREQPCAPRALGRTAGHAHVMEAGEPPRYE